MLFTCTKLQISSVYCLFANSYYSIITLHLPTKWLFITIGNPKILVLVAHFSLVLCYTCLLIFIFPCILFAYWLGNTITNLSYLLCFVERKLILLPHRSFQDIRVIQFAFYNHVLVVLPAKSPIYFLCKITYQFYNSILCKHISYKLQLP